MDQPAVTVVEITDPAAADAGIEVIDLDAVQLQSRPFRALRVIVRLDTAVVVYHSSNARIRTRTSVRDGLLAFVTFGPRAKGTVNGLPVRPDVMLAATSDAEARFVVDVGWESITFLVPPQDVSASIATRQRLSEFRIPQGVEPLRVDEGKVRTLFDWGKRLVDTAAHHPIRFNEWNNGRIGAQAELLETLLASLSAAKDFEPTRGDRTRRAYSLIVKKAEDHILSQTGEHVHVTDLCRLTAVSERTLESAFKEVTGLTPVAYLTRVRLHRVRQALMTATRASTTVSAEALSCGFWHFGDFSRAYRDCFGELPSATLRRRPGDPPR